MYNIKLEKFEGSLDLLLQLIEREEMDISEISLANIADEFIEYIATSQKSKACPELAERVKSQKLGREGREEEEVKIGVDANELSDFLVIAAKLLYIKSRYLMPFLEYDDEDEEVGDLENRLKIYKEFLDASKKIEELYGDGRIAYVRERNLADLINTTLTPVCALPAQIGGRPLKGGTGVLGEAQNFAFPQKQKSCYFFPPKKLEKEDLKNSFEELIGSLRTPFVLDQENMEKTITVQEKIEQIRLLILKKANLNFTKMIYKADKKDIIVSFLSILELVKEQFIIVEQDGYFSEIRIRRMNTD